MNNDFYTHNSRTVFYKGNVFDSLIELRFALMIEQTHAWLRNGIELYYGINVQPSGVKQNLHCYRPDFLIRNFKTGIAEVIEIKPNGFTMSSQRRRAKIVSSYTKRFEYDWTFRLVTDSEIVLSNEKWIQYKTILSTQKDLHHQPSLKLLQNSTNLSDKEYQHFVQTGVVQTFVH